MATRRITLTLFSSSTCSLCTTAKEAITRVQKQHPFQLSVLDIHKDDECPKEFAEKYMFDIPVVHLNDKFLTQHRVPEDKLLAALKKYEVTGEVESSILGYGPSEPVSESYSQLLLNNDLNDGSEEACIASATDYQFDSQMYRKTFIASTQDSKYTTSNDGGFQHVELGESVAARNLT
ncbi:hypothetical protein VTP01DRAFT_22 [Rhizomucor pusillus]|uniref:uncharacterized protein n=1 Tax=Rhizomucor pusillus TaxID=4840 RepID=UPI00374405BB